MKKCIYIYNKETYLSYNDLVSAFTDADVDSQLSIMFSLNHDDQIEIYDKLKAANKQYNFTVTKSSVDINPTIDVNGKMSILNYIDSMYFRIDDEPPMFLLNIEEYLDLMEARWKKDNSNISEEEIETKRNFIKANWNKIAEAASDLHRIVNRYNSAEHTDAYFSGATLNTPFRPIFDLVGFITKEIERLVALHNGGAKRLKNLNVEALLKDLDQSIVGHIDYIFIRPDGTVNLYNLKASIDPETSWSASKKAKFKQELAFIKRILENNGIRVQDIRVHIVPILMHYDETFSHIESLDVYKPVSYDSFNGIYDASKEDNIAANLVNAEPKIKPADPMLFVDATMCLRTIFPDMDIKATGIRKSAQEWLDDHWNTIAKQSKDTYGWDISFPGEKEVIHVSDTNTKSKNKEVLDAVIDRIDQLTNNASLDTSVNRVIADIENSFDRGYTYLSTTSTSVATVLDALLTPYFEVDKYDKDHKPIYKWNLLKFPELTQAGIVLFENNDTHQIDVVDITPFDVSIPHKFKNRNNLLGAYIPDLNSLGFTMESNYGNIEAMRVMSVLNALAPNFSFKPQLGTLKIVGMQFHNKQSREIDLGSMLDPFSTALEVALANNKDLHIKNNFRELHIQGINPVDSVLQTWREFLLVNTNLKGLTEDMTSQTQIDGTLIDGLETAKTIDAKIQKLETILDKLKDMASKIGFQLSPESIQHNLKSENLERRAIANVYKEALFALNKFHGDLSFDNEEFSSWSEYLLRPQSIPNTNVRTVAYMFLKSIDKIANTIMDEYTPIRTVFQNYYKAKGYTPAQNSTLGNLATVFENLYELDNEGKRTMRFKNPYDDAQWGVSDKIDRDFLKRILFEMNKIRYKMRGLTFTFTSVNDPKIIETINKAGSFYLNVPLERASAATRRTNIKNGIKEFGRRWLKRIMHPLDAYKEIQEGILNSDDESTIKLDIRNLQAYNPFMRSEIPNSRENYLSKYPADYFEYNVENLMIDYLEKHILSVEYNKMLTRTKGILLSLELKGETEGDMKNILHTIKTIEDFLSIAVYNRSIMEESSQKVEAILAPIRHAVSTCYIAANPAGSVRDIIQGILENTVRSLNHFLTKIRPKDVAFGYKQVIEEGPTNAMSVTKLSLLNLKFRISNLDVAKISEGLKTGRSGLANIDNLLYQTMRRPDYINRMVLLTAQMHLDGCYDAYYIDKEGKLVYDYKRDERFKAYANNDRSDMKKWNLQRAAYMDRIRIFNKERGLSLKEGDPLPEAYTSDEITTIKLLSDSIYGSYNASTKAKYEWIAVGRNFTSFSTWMNGIVDNYMMSPLLSVGQSEWRLMEENGEKLYYDDDNNIVPESDPNANKDRPVQELVPTMVLGIFYTLGQSLKTIVSAESFGKGWKDFEKDIWSNPRNRQNIHKLWSDMMVCGLIALLFKLAISPAYQEHKKLDDGKNIAVNAITELLYKGASNSYDGFKGPFAPLSYIGNSTNPATYKLQTKVITDLYKFVLGDKTFGSLVVGAQALPRSLKDTYAMWARDNG